MDFCACLTISPDLSRVSNPIPYLRIFSDRVIVGALVYNGTGVNNITVEGYFRDVAHIFAGVGAEDPV